jgi:hypothetical protein
MSPEATVEIPADLDYRRNKLRCGVGEETTKRTDWKKVSTAMQFDIVITWKMTDDPTMSFEW